MLFKYEWELVKSPAGAHQWQAINVDEKDMIPDAHDSKKKHRPMMTTADLALRFDPIYSNISKRFHGDPTSFADTFARAWFKLTHRDMGPIARYLGPEVPKEHLIWQDPLPDTKAQQLSEGDLAALKKMILNSGLSVAQLVTTAWCSASTFRVSDLRGGANGARLRLLPQKDWEVNHPAELTKVIETLEGIQLDFNRKLKMNTSLADTIVLAGCVGVQKAAKDAGYEVEVPVAVGRVDTTQELTDADSFGLLEPIADGFRNYARKGTGKHGPELLVDRAHLLSLTAPEMTLLIGGMRVLGTNFGDSKHGVFTSNRGSLTNDFFINVLDAGTQWKPSSQDGVYDVVNRATGKLMWTATGVDLVFGSNSQLRAIADVYAQRGNEFKFVADFIAAWDKVMNLDRYDLK